MVHVFLVCSALLAAPTPEDRSAYEAAKVQAGRNADAHVKLALWCEQHGLTAERAKHLALAVLIEPKNTTARGLLGLVDFGGRWQTPDAVSAKLQEDADRNATFAEYAARRARTPGSAEAQWKLALWCEQNGLKAESRAHCAAVLRRDPNHEGARKRLGYKKHGQRWVTDAQLAAERAEADAQKKADKHWRALLVKWRDDLGDKQRGMAADEALSHVTDPRAAPVVWDVFAKGNEAQQAKAVQLFGQIEGLGASLALATMAVGSNSAAIRQRATETLRSRDPREFLGLLVGMIRDPIKFELRPGQAPGQFGELLIKGKRANVDRVYQVDPAATTRMLGWLPPRLFGPLVPFDPYGGQSLSVALQTPHGTDAAGGISHKAGSGATNAGVPSPASNPNLPAVLQAIRRDREIAEDLSLIQQSINLVQQRLQNDVAMLEAMNADIKNTNSVVLPVLRDLTGQDLGDSVDAWQGWWGDQQGLVYDPPPSEVPTVTEFVTNPEVGLPFRHSCFGAGTPVRTLDGPRPIESIRAGDQVLTQDVRTGKLAFEPVMAIYHNKPAATLKLTLGSETVVATSIHRFWKAGHGWAMARELKVGDPIRTLSGVVKIAAIEDTAVQPVFNLEVASGQSFFVGEQGTLVHDNSLVQPSPDPFDAAPELTRSAAAATSR